MPTEYDLSRAFERIESYLISSMMRNFKHHRAEETEHGYNWEQWQTKQLEALETYRRNNREKFSSEFAELNDKVGEMLRNTASDSAYKQERRILEAIRKGYKPDHAGAHLQAAFFKLNERKMNALVEATTHDLEKAEFAVLRRSNDAYRRAIFDAQVFMNSGSATYEQAVDMAVKDMLSAGLQCVEYSNGARHTLPDYSEMAIRTANKRAYLRGQGDMLNKYGVTTVIINRRHGACGKCADYVGMVFIDDVYAGGKPTDAGGKYPLLSDAMKSGLFHPRCKDSASPYFEGISTPPDREVLPKKAQEDLTEIERAEQKEQYGRRMEKMYRRLEKYALDPGNKKLYAGRRSQWSEYTEKWHDYHEKLLAKAEESGIIKKIDSVQERVRELSEKQYRFGTKDDFSRMSKEHNKNIPKEDIAQIKGHKKSDGSSGGYVATHNYREINTAMRKDAFDLSLLDEDDQKTVISLRNAIQTNTLDDDYTLVRYVNADYLSSVFGVKNKWGESLENHMITHGRPHQVEYIISGLKEHIGDIIKEKSFISTSVVQEKNIMTDKGVRFEIKAPKGTNAYVSKNKKESECILGGDENGLDLYIEKIWFTDLTHQVIIEAFVL